MTRTIRIAVGIIVMAVIVSSDTGLHKETATLQISDIFGLQQALDIRPTMGTGFNIERTAVINATGAIDGAEGNPSDCVLVDGSSGPCGTSVQVSATYVDAEIPMGIMDGVNGSFTLANVPNPPASLHVYRNGVRLRQASDYTLNGAVMTLIGTQIPNATDDIVVDYRY